MQKRNAPNDRGENHVAVHSGGNRASVSILLVFAGVVAMMLVVALPAYAQSPNDYIVKWGDTLYSIALRYDTTVKSIMAENGLTSTRIYAGQCLSIPGGGPAGAMVDGWQGDIVKLAGGVQVSEYFERGNGQRFGIDGANDALRARLDELRWSGGTFRVLGWLRTGVPVHGGRMIVAERIELVPGSLPAARDLTAFATVSASSRLRTDRWGQYQAWMAVDGRRSSAWVEGMRGSGEGEWIMLTFPRPVEVHSVGLDVAFDSSADLFYKNNRIKRATLVFSNGEQLELGFADRQGMQTIPLVRAPGSSIETTFVKIVIEEVYPGWKYDDTCLAEVEVHGITQ